MDFTHNINQIEIYESILAKWRDYLSQLQEKTLSKKGTIKLVEINDRKELLKCEDLKNLDVYKELKTIHNLIDLEKETYERLSDIILNPKGLSFFTLKSTVNAKRNKELKSYFDSLFDLVNEQIVRINSVKKSIKLMQLEQVNIANEEYQTASTKIIKKSGITTIIKKQTELNEEDKKTEITAISKEQTYHQKGKDTKTQEIKAEEDVISLTQNKETPEKINTEIPSQENDEFDYEEEIKKILGL